MGCKSGAKDPNMQRRDSEENDRIDRDNSNNSGSSRAMDTSVPIDSTTTNNCPVSPNSVNNTTSIPQGQGHMHHSATDPNLRGHRPRSAHQHRLIGQILRNIGDGYCYSCGIALRQMGDQLAGETEVRRALSTGDLPSSVKDT